MDDGNCNLTIKIGNENDTFVINKDNRWQEKKYFKIFRLIIIIINSGDYYYEALKDLDNLNTSESSNSMDNLGASMDNLTFTLLPLKLFKQVLIFS